MTVAPAYYEVPKQVSSVLLRQDDPGMGGGEFSEWFRGRTRLSHCELYFACSLHSFMDSRTALSSPCSAVTAAESGRLLMGVACQSAAPGRLATWGTRLSCQSEYDSAAASSHVVSHSNGARSAATSGQKADNTLLACCAADQRGLGVMHMLLSAQLQCG